MMINIYIGDILLLLHGKKGTLRIIVRRAYTAFLNGNLFQEELRHIEACFTEINDCPKWLLKQTFDSFKTSNKNYNNKMNNKNNNVTNLNNLSDKTYHIKLPYKGSPGTNVIKSIKTSTMKLLPEKHDVRIILTGTKLKSQFNTKDDTNKQHKHNLVYFSRCPSTTCTDS